MESKIQQPSSSSSEPLQVSVPTEIVFQILLRLPVESLLRCKPVCKLWYSLISDPHFINSHLKTLSTISNNNNYMHHQIYFNSSELLLMGIRKTLKYFPVYDVLLYDELGNAFDVDYVLKDKSVSILVSCNGLLCVLIDHDSLCVWNPSTRTCSKRFSPCYDYNMRFQWHVVYGFGYDESTDDYKLVELSFLFNSGPTKYDTLANMYSLKSGNWKRIDDFPYGIPSDHSGEFSNGCLHWVTDKKLGLSYRWTIVYFDLAKETYGELSLPVVYDEGGDHDKSLTLGVLGERLCVLCNHNASNCGYQADVWVMKVYGETDSWTKLMSISYPTHLGNKPLSTIPNLGNKPINMFSAPLCIFNDGKVLLHLGSILLLYDSKDSSFSDIQYNFDNWHQPLIIVESLVSPYALPDLGKLRI